MMLRGRRLALVHSGMRNPNTQAHSDIILEKGKAM